MVSQFTMISPHYMSKSLKMFSPLLSYPIPPLLAPKEHRFQESRNQKNHSHKLLVLRMLCYNNYNLQKYPLILGFRRDCF